MDDEDRGPGTEIAGPDRQTAQDSAKGIAAILASAFGFAMMAAFVRLCDDFGAEVSSFQKSFFRNLIAFAIALAVLARERRSRKIVSPRGSVQWGLVLMRAAAGTVGIFGNFYALSKIPIGEAMALNKTAPWFTVVFSWMFLRERANARQLSCLAAAFAGVLLVLKPGFRGSGTFPSLCALAGGLGAGIAYTCLRRLGTMKVDSAFIILFFSAFSCLASLPPMIASFDPMTPAQVAVLLGAGASAAIGQFGITVAYRYAAPRRIAVFDYTSVIFTAVFGYLLFSQIPDLTSVAGFAIIVLAIACRKHAVHAKEGVCHG